MKFTVHYDYTEKKLILTPLGIDNLQGLKKKWGGKSACRRLLRKWEGSLFVL